MLYKALVVLSFLQSVIGFTLMSSSVIRFREPVKYRMIKGFLVMLAGISLLSYTLFTRGMDSVNSFAVLVILVIELAWFLICSDDPFFVSLFSFLSFVNIYISISYISDNLALHTTGSAFVLERIIIRTLIYLLILPLFFKLISKRFRRLVNTLSKEWREASIVPLMFLILQITILYYPGPYWLWENNAWSRLIIAMVYLLFLAVYYLLYIQANGIAEKYALEKRQLLMAQQEKLWEAELLREKAAAALFAQQRHDMHHHNSVIIGLLQSSELENLQAYMTSFDLSLDTHNDNVYCLNPIANSIINIFVSKASAAKIETSFNISVPENIGIEHIDLTCVLGNALENALEGCLRLPQNTEKQIDIMLKYFDHRLRIKIENSCEENILFAGELPVTQKKVGGTGTKSILYTAELYDGTAGFFVRDGRFITQIVLNDN